MPSHIVTTCTCGPDRIAGRPVHSACEVPGHGDVPPLPVDPQTLVDAGWEALDHLQDAVLALMKARAAWVSRGLPSTNAFPQSLDRLAGKITYQNDRLRRWTVAAERVAERRQEADEFGGSGGSDV